MSDEQKAITATVVCDNYEYASRLQTAWGFSCLIEGLDRTILFDTNGSGGVLLHNMEQLDIDPTIVDIVVFSHPHADHTGGLSELLGQNADITCYALGTFPAGFANSITSAGAEYTAADRSTKLCDGAFTTGKVAGPIPQQAIVVRGSTGHTVITGCAHPGVVNMVRAGKDACSCPVDAVFGGFHTRALGEKQALKAILFT